MILGLESVRESDERKIVRRVSLPIAYTAIDMIPSGANRAAGHGSELSEARCKKREVWRVSLP